MVKIRSLLSVYVAYVMSVCTLPAKAVVSTITGGSVYDVVTGFSSENPNSPWSYTYDGTLFTQYEPAVNPLGALFKFGTPFWWSGQQMPDSAILAQNLTGDAVSYQSIREPNDTLRIDPEGWSNIVVTFTAPSTGIYSVTGSFLGIDVGEYPHSVELVSNGVIELDSTLSYFAENDAFNFVSSLEDGQSIHFIVDTGIGGGCNYCDLSTGLEAKVSLSSSVPEPSTWVMMLIGFSCIGYKILARSTSLKVELG